MKRKKTARQYSDKKQKRPAEFPLRIWGNYVGPGWSAGKYQNSVDDPSVPAIDAFDETAREHDRAYAMPITPETPALLKTADLKFAAQNIGRGPLRTIAGLAVGLQGLLRPGSIVKELRPHKSVKTFSSFLMPTNRRKNMRRGYKRKAKKKISKTYRKKSYKPKRKFYKKKTNKLAFKYVNSRGYQSNQESNIIYDGSNCIYLAYGTPSSAMFQAVVRAIWKATLAKAGLTLKAWTDKIDTANQSAFRWTIQYYIRPSSTPAAPSELVHFIPVNGESHEMTCLYMEVLLNDVYKNTDMGVPYLLNSRLEILDGTTNGDRTTVVGKLQLEYAKFEFQDRARLRVQNRTLSTSDSASTDVVDTVPLGLKVYRSSKWRDGVVPIQDEDVTTRAQFKLGPEGYIYYEASDMSNDSDRNPYRKHPPAFFLGSKKTENYVVQPAQIIEDKSVYVASMKINTFLEKFAIEGRTRLCSVTGTTFNIGNNGNSIPNLGKFTVLAFEKFLTPGVIEPKINLAAQLDHYYACVIKQGRTRSIPFTLAYH